jgi:hypothetical protein
MKQFDQSKSGAKIQALYKDQISANSKMQPQLLEFANQRMELRKKRSMGLLESVNNKKGGLLNTLAGSQTDLHRDFAGNDNSRQKLIKPKSYKKIFDD